MDAQTISVLVTATSVTVAAIYYIISLRNANKLRETQVFLQVSSYMANFTKYYTKFNWAYKFDSFEDYWQKYGPETNPDEWEKQFELYGFYESLGILVKKKLLNADLVDELIGGFVQDYWDKAKPITEALRKRWPAWLENMEFLVNELENIRRRKKSAHLGKLYEKTLS